MRERKRFETIRKGMGILAIAIAVFILFSGIGSAFTIPHEEWNGTYGGANSDQAKSVQQTSDGGYILAGYTYSFGAGLSDVWFIKTDLFGNKQWDRFFGGVDIDKAESVQQTSDGGYILAGQTRLLGAGYSDAWLIKTNSSGNELWNMILGGTREDYAQSVQQTSDGGYILAGYTRSFGAGYLDALLIKTDSFGNELWNKTFGGINNDYAFSVQQTSDGGYILAGYTNSFGAGLSDAWLIKTDSSGNKQWEQTFGGTNNDRTFFVQQTLDGEFILAGSTGSLGAGYSDAWLIKTNSSGNELWNMTFGGAREDYAQSVQQTSDGGYILAGYTNSFGAGLSDAWLIKTDSSGNKQWEQTFGGTNNEYAYSVRQTLDSGYILAGYTYSFGAGNSDAWLIKLSSDTNESTPMTVSINSPKSDDIFSTNALANNITFNGTVSGGTPPYEYSWLVDGTKINSENVPEWNISGSEIGVGLHTLKLQVKDANNVVNNSSEISLDVYTKTIVIVPIEFSDRAHSSDAENLRLEAIYLKHYYSEQSFGKERIGYKLYSNSSGNEGWFVRSEKLIDIYQGAYLSQIPSPAPQLICSEGIASENCTIPTKVQPKYSSGKDLYLEWMYIWHSAMEEADLTVRAVRYELEGFWQGEKEFKPNDFDVGIVVIPEPNCPSSLIDISPICRPVAPNYNGTGAIIIDESRKGDPWVHEMGHIYGRQEEEYGVGNWGIMYGGDAQNPPPPVLLYDKEYYGWIKKNTPAYNYGIFAVQRINDSTNLTAEGMLKFGDENKYYIFEGRQPYDGVRFEANVAENKPLESIEGVEVYRVENSGAKISARIACEKDGSPCNDQNRVSMIDGETILINGATASVRAFNDSNGQLKVEIKSRESFEEKVWKAKLEIQYRDRKILTFSPEQNIDVDLHAVAPDGRRIGVDNETGEFINEIEGSNWSGNYMGGGEEWIAVPDSEVVTPYVVLSQDLKDILANDSNASVEVTSTLTIYDEAGNSTGSIPQTMTVNQSNMDENLTLPEPVMLPDMRYINGTVIDSASREGLADVTVSTNTGNSTTTGATGFYSLSVTEGEYNLTAKLDPTYYMNDTVQVSTFGKAVAEQDIELLIKPTGSISGSVTN